VHLADGSVLDRSGRPRIVGPVGDHDADPERVAELLAALAGPATPVEHSSAAQVATLTVSPRAGDDVTLDFYADHTLARHGELGALRPAPEQWTVLTRPTAAFVDATRWAEEPTTIASVVVDGAAFARGQVIGEWTGGVDHELLDALATALAVVRAPAGPAPDRVEHRVELRVAPPVGPATTHHLDIGPASVHGCAALADGAPVVLPLAGCTAVLAVSAARASRPPTR